jgi:hypothetical protein
MASLGHSLSQEPQSTQVSGSIKRFPSFSLIAPFGQASSQTPQLTHSSEILYAIYSSKIGLLPENVSIIGKSFKRTNCNYRAPRIAFARILSPKPPPAASLDIIPLVTHCDRFAV